MKNWFHIRGFRKTIDLDCVSEIHWNTKGKNCDGTTTTVTTVYMGTAVAYDSDANHLQYNKIEVSRDDDRKALYNVVFANEIANNDVPFLLDIDEPPEWNL